MLCDIIDAALIEQTEHSARLTPAMVRRGTALREIGKSLSGLLESEEWAKGLKVEYSGGRGGQSRVPWVRVFDPKASPSSTKGWYIVLLFAFSGEYCYFSLNQGTSHWDGKNVYRESLAVIHDRTRSAYEILGASGRIPSGSVAAIDLQEPRGSLGEGYQHGSVVAFRHALGDPRSDGEVINLVKILELARRQIDPSSPNFAPGAPYRIAVVQVESPPAVLLFFGKDPAKLERALQAHGDTQNAVAAIVNSKGFAPLSPKGEPDFDLAWSTETTLHVVEVKSMPVGGEVSQLRLGFGQVLQYQH